MSAALTARTVDRAQTDGRTRANTLILFGASADSSVKGSKSSSPSSSILGVGSKFFVLTKTESGTGAVQGPLICLILI